MTLIYAKMPPKLCLKAESRTATQYLNDSLDIRYLTKRCTKHMAIVMHTKVHKKSPPKCQIMFTPVSEIHSRKTSAQNILNFYLPRLNPTTAKRNIRYYDDVIWNSLPMEMRIIESHDQFKTEINRYSISTGSCYKD